MSYAQQTDIAPSSDIALNSIWKLLEPAVPDCLKQTQPGIYEARWWTPVPNQEIEMLAHIPTIIVVESPYEPDNLPGGLAVLFRVR
ncbi:MAG: hypothetical protein SGI73_04675 [Chloroflexota bacterium]|nr:hypothetical protein [Chloroflexota bacterium]